MTAKYSITMYCPSDGEYIAEHMREMDVFECRATGFATPLEAITASVKASNKVWTFCYGGIPLCVFGIVPDSCGGSGIWELGVDAIRQHKKAFLQKSRQVIDGFLKDYSYLTNVVCMENYESVRWLKWLGAEFQEETAMLMGKPFSRFYIERSEG